jgi:hypothetical protein
MKKCPDVPLSAMGGTGGGLAGTQLWPLLDGDATAAGGSVMR